MAAPTPAAVAVALVRFGRVEPRKRSAGLLSSIITEEAQRIEGSEGEDVKRNLDLDSMEDAIDSALSCLEIPDVYDTLEDIRTYNPAGLSNVEGQAKNFEQVAQGVMSSLLMVVSAGEGMSGYDWDIVRFLTVLGSFRARKTEWSGRERRKIAGEILRSVGKASGDLKGGETSISALVNKHAAELLKKLTRRRRKQQDDRSSAKFMAVFEWAVLNTQHRVLTEIFGDRILPEMLRLVDSTHIPTKARGVRIMSHCISELLTTELRFHSGLFLHRIQKVLAFHQVEVEGPTFDCVISILPRLETKNRQIRAQSLEVIGSVVKEIEWVSMSTSDEPVRRVYEISAKLPTLVAAFATDNARHMREVFTSIARFAQVSDSHVALAGLDAMQALCYAVPERVPHHQGKMFEALVRAYICHSPHSRLCDVAADSKDEDSKISSEESDRKDNKSNPQVCDRVVRNLVVLREICGESFDGWMELGKTGSDSDNILLVRLLKPLRDQFRSALPPEAKLT